ncbi:MAG: flagellar hook-associated protein FlgK [Azoarcus sp.]|jgi:flagellar hook-associated protein 1 FlgK|nr:flagellar hook-associated protein FlgK [Azoarcus sp.]
MAGLLNIGLTGVNAAQGQLITTSHNIANANVAGYHRQKVIQASQAPYFSGVGFFGTGTKMQAVTRSYDQFLENEVLNAATKQNMYAAYYAQISQIDNLLADPTAGLSPSIDAFFAGVRDVAAAPTSSAARQSMLSSAQMLVERFHSLNERLNEIREGVEYDIRASVDQINTLASAIAELNQRIVVAQSAGPTKPANDLLDQRGQLISELNDLIQVTTQVEDDGMLSVFFGSGQSLVNGNMATKLAAVPSKNDPQRYSIAIIPRSGTPISVPERLITGGQLGGLLQFRSESLDPAQNRLGMLAVSIASAFNNQHKLGVDLAGELGLDFFQVPTPRIYPTNAAVVGFDFDTNPNADDISGLGLLTDADYELKFDGTDYVITNLSTRASKTLTTPVDSFEGLKIDVSASALAAGETALIQPTRYGAEGIKTAITDPRLIAAGGPVMSSVPTTNSGTGKVSGIVMQDTTGVIPASSPTWEATITFDNTTNPPTLNLPSPGGFAFVDPATGALSASATFNPATMSAGQEFTITGPGGFTFTFTLSGTPANGDVFNLVPTRAGLYDSPPSDTGVADNRNANLLGALQTTKLLFANSVGEPTATFDTAYSQLVNKVGNKTHEMKVSEQTQATLYAQACETRDSLSAVNLDEEAADLVRYQQMYQASARVMSIAQGLFDELISIVR